jgi:predicted HAD superfamily Cof-like phosphohydrolase
VEKFVQDIVKFNSIYKLENNDKPTLLDCERIENFTSILKEEVEESSDIIEKYKSMCNDRGEMSEEARLALLTDMSDWLGDLVVYCASEARRWGLPLEKILEIIMQSNFSKLDADGNPIYDERGKVLKGPNYWKPEPKIEDLLR